jgi:hypothetical protein
MTSYKLEYLRASLRNSEQQQREFTMRESVQVYIKDKLTSDIDVQDILDRVNNLIPNHLMSEVDSIFIGMFEEFEETDINAVYKDGAIYVTNDQDDEADLVDDIIHEIAHSLESPYGYEIYGDGKLEREFLTKREILYEILKAEGLEPDESLFKNPEYDRELDNYLYEGVGYERLNFIATSYGIFTSAYPATSLREYYASGFEYFFLEDRKYLKEISPTLYQKIEDLYEL